jgi:iron complex outermembrane receptor protein
MNGNQQIKCVALLFCLLTTFQFAFAQSKTITGRVTDSRDGSGIPNVSIFAKGTQIGTQTDTSGSFQLTVPSPTKTLTLSSIGYSSQHIDVSKTDHVQVALVGTATSLNDVVVIGYGTAMKKDLTGAIASVKEKDFNKGPYMSPDMLIQGKVSGVQIIANDGSPGGATTIKIRGNSAITGNGQPLFVVDGVPLDGRTLEKDINPLNFLNPIDIASIDVLKDASAAAIYGSRAAYGVIIINTKKGQKGETRIDVAVSAGVSSALKKIRVLNASEYREAIKYYGVDPSFDKGGDADGQDAILQHGWQQNYFIAGSGGTETSKYRFSAGYQTQDGIVTNTGFKKYTGDFSANLKCLKSKRLGLDVHLNSSQFIHEGSDVGSGNGGTVFFGITWNPTAALRNKDSSLRMLPSEGVNPIAFSEYVKEKLKVTTILASISPYYKFSDWLEYKLLLSINYSSGISRSSINQALGIYQGFPATGSASISNNELTTAQMTHTLNFNKEIFHGLNLNALAGFEYMKFTSQGFNVSANGPQNVGFGNYGIDYTNYIQFSDPNTRAIASYLDPISELQSFFGRTIFNYKDKYMLTATFRADGSTKFGANNKYGYFPSFAAAWNISKENFFNLAFLNSMTVRAGWGKTGNQEFPAGSSQALYGFQNNGVIIQLNSPNPDLKWQSDRQYNIGIDFSMFDNRVSGTLDYFDKSTSNLLFPNPPIQPAPPNSTIQWINLDGQVANRGFEVLISGNIIKQKNFSWDLSVNAGFLRNNVSGLKVPLYTGDVGSPVEIIQNGHPMNTFYTRKYLGIDPSTGQSIYEDKGNTFYYIGDPNPKTLLGISSTLGYKKFSLTANIHGAFGQQIFNADLFNFLQVYGIMGGNMALSVYKNPVKERLSNPAQSASSRYIQNGDYLKMGNLTISYNFGSLVKGFKDASFYVTAQNLFLITKYEGFDPEVNVDRNVNGVPSFGIDHVRYPSSRTFIFGINFSLQ